MDKRLLSIVIPTYNRSSTLGMTLNALVALVRKQQDTEILVIDDGSSDNTREIVTAIAVQAGIELIYFRQDNQGPAAARNNGLSHARGDVVLFLDDDIIASDTLLVGHLAMHQRYASEPISVLGLVRVSPDTPQTMLNRSHAVSMWRTLRDGDQIHWRFFFTGNVSVNRRFMLEHDLFFDTEMTRMHDTELGYRCWKQGMRLFYCRVAAGDHCSDFPLAALPKMSMTYGRMHALMHYKHPETRTELGDYLIFSLRRSPARVARDLIKHVFRNRATIPLYLWLLTRFPNSDTFLLRRCCSQVRTYYQLVGYRQQSRELCGESQRSVSQ